MKFEVLAVDLAKVMADACIMPVSEDDKNDKTLSALDAKIGGIIKDAIDSKEFMAEAGELCLLHVKKGLKAKRIVLLGLGKKADIDLKKIRGFIAKTVMFLRTKNIKSCCMQLIRSSDDHDSLEDIAVAHSIMPYFALYEFKKYKTEKKEETKVFDSITLVCEKEELNLVKHAVNEGKIIAEAMNGIRDLVNEPANNLTPRSLAAYAKNIAKKNGMKCIVKGKKEIQQMGMHAFLGVAKGSIEEPRFIVLEHKPQKPKARICVVGKGITFDSGGISIKPSRNMDEMKMDMSGAAATIGIMDAVSRLKLPVHVYGIVAACENMPSGSAQRPGDVVRSMSGKTIEIANTDAEGRLILADALHYATLQKPDAIVDLATLTGAIIVSLGVHATGIFSNDDILISRMKTAGDHSGELVWHLPTWNSYQEDVKSEIADIRNIGLAGQAGSITAAMFLKFFVGDIPWVHLDIAGTAWTDGRFGTSAKGATGVGVRLVTKFIELFAKGN